MAETSGEALHHALLPGAQAWQIEPGTGEFDTPVLRLVRFLDQLGHVQQGLGGDATAVETDAAGIDLGIDECDFQAEVGSQERSRIPARASADDGNAHARLVDHDLSSIRTYP